MTSPAEIKRIYVVEVSLLDVERRFPPQTVHVIVRDDLHWLVGLTSHLREETTIDPAIFRPWERRWAGDSARLIYCIEEDGTLVINPEEAKALDLQQELACYRKRGPSDQAKPQKRHRFGSLGAQELKGMLALPTVCRGFWEQCRVHVIARLCSILERAEKRYGWLPDASEFFLRSLKAELVPVKMD